MINSNSIEPLLSEFLDEFHDGSYPDSITFEYLEKHVDDTIHKIENAGRSEQLENGLCVFVGETLRQLFNGQWVGKITNSTIENYYNTIVRFGSYEYNPFSFISYRLANGEAEEGSFHDHIGRIKPLIVARKKVREFGFTDSVD